MKIAFDYQTFALQSYGGISRYFVRLAQQLATLGEEPHIMAPFHRNQYLEELPPNFAQGIRLKGFPPKTTRLFLLANHMVCSRWVKKIHPDVFHETYFTSQPIRGDGMARIVTVHDMIHERFSSDFRPDDPTRKNKRDAIARADHVISISQSTKRDLCEIYNMDEEKITVVHHGFEKLRSGRNGELIRQAKRPYLLYVGNRSGYKNFSRMLRAIASRRQLLQEFDVIAFGGGTFNHSEAELITSLGFRPDSVRQIGGGDDILGQLYESAMAFVYPSMYEGFGLPPLEAMAHNCPVVSSHSSSMPEVIGNAAEYFQPADIDDQAEAIERVVSNDARRVNLIESGKLRLKEFSWARCAEETRDVYRHVLAGKA